MWKCGFRTYRARWKQSLSSLPRKRYWIACICLTMMCASAVLARSFPFYLPICMLHVWKFSLLTFPLVADASFCRAANKFYKAVGWADSTRISLIQAYRGHKIAHSSASPHWHCTSTSVSNEVVVGMSRLRQPQLNHACGHRTNGCLVFGCLTGFTERVGLTHIEFLISLNTDVVHGHLTAPVQRMNSFLESSGSFAHCLELTVSLSVALFSCCSVWASLRYVVQI